MLDSRRRTAFALLVLLASATGCLKSLDESLLDAKDGGAGSAGASGSGGGGGTGGGGTGGGGGGTGGTGGGGTGGGDSGTDAGVVPWDQSKYPVTVVTSTPGARSVIAADGDDIFGAEFGASPAPLSRYALTGGGGVLVPGVSLKQPRALATISGSLNVFSAGEDASGAVLERAPKVGGTVSTVSATGTIEAPTSVFAASDSFAYVTAQASSGTVAVLRFSLAGGPGTAEELFVATSAETGGPVVATPGCVYWVSNGNVWVLPTSGGTRVTALSADIADAVGVTADAVNLYYTRSSGSVWKKPLDSGCVAGTQPETQLGSGFDGIGSVTAFEGKVAWTASGAAGSNAGGGVFVVAASGGTVTQIAPEEGGPDYVLTAGSFVVFTTAAGDIRKVSKNPK
jgi:hypothetical protein